jgi:anaerobic nitric oxide reductase flavorubredoxin
MNVFEIAPKIHWVGIASKEKGLFENLWELDHGVNYNSYLLCGEKSALIDLCPEPMMDELISKIEGVSDISKLSCLVFNHLEPDHTGAVKAIRRKLPGLEIIASKKGVEMLGTLFGIKENVREVKEGDTLDLGGLSLKFMMTPMIHWPETMMALEETTKTLFSSDCFGAFGATESSIFDDEAKEACFDDERFRYFVNVLGGHWRHIEKALPKVSVLNPAVVAPSHGPVYRDAKKIIDAYIKWCGYGAGKCEDRVALISSTMYGRTAEAVAAVRKGLDSAGIATRVADAVAEAPAYILPEIYKAKGILIASPTYDGGLFPKILDILARAKVKDIKGKKVVFCGSCAWAPAAKKELAEWCEKLSWELVDAVEFKGMVTVEVEAQLVEMGLKFGELIKAAQI